MKYNSPHKKKNDEKKNKQTFRHIYTNSAKSIFNVEDLVLPTVQVKMTQETGRKFFLFFWIRQVVGTEQKKKIEF